MFPSKKRFIMIQKTNISMINIYREIKREMMMTSWIENKNYTL